ncbi:MAG: four helix bundle protein [Amphiplicatus sp.]
MKSFEDLDIWKKALDLTEAVYRASAKWPGEEKFCLTQQIRRAAASIPANIAEGAERQGPREFLRFLSIARGSLAETKTFLILAERLAYMDLEQGMALKSQLDEVGRMLSGLSRSLQSKL